VFLSLDKEGRNVDVRVEEAHSTVGLHIDIEVGGVALRPALCHAVLILLTGEVLEGDLFQKGQLSNLLRSLDQPRKPVRIGR